MFRDTTPIYVERPLAQRRGARDPARGVESVQRDDRSAGRACAPEDSGIAFRLEVAARDVPLYVYRTRESFAEHMERVRREALREGLHGWQVMDCIVTMTRCSVQRRGRAAVAAWADQHRRGLPEADAARRQRRRSSAPDGGLRADRPRQRSRCRPASSGPCCRRCPARCERRDAVAARRAVDDRSSPAGRGADELQRQLAGLTGGEGVLESTFAGYQPVSGDQPERRVRLRAQG